MNSIPNISYASRSCQLEPAKTSIKDGIIASSFSISVDTKTTFPSIDSDKQKTISKCGDTDSFGGSPTETSFSQSMALSHEK